MKPENVTSLSVACSAFSASIEARQGPRKVIVLPYFLLFLILPTHTRTHTHTHTHTHTQEAFDHSLRRLPVWQAEAQYFYHQPQVEN